jgi:ubiquinone/menaquinone biosynthesis C-methylase UbiE
MNIRAIPDEITTALTRSRYQRLSSVYDLMERASERRYRPWRKNLWSQVCGPEILEVGVGTGKNMLYYPPGLHITAIDLTPGMLKRARKRAVDLNLTVDLRLGDAQALEFPAARFDAAVATFVFCSVPDPILGLHELGRVVKPGGQVLLLEHVRSENQFLGSMMDILNSLVVRITGANINRRTVENVQKSGLVVEKVEQLGRLGMFRMILAHTS